MEPWERGAGHIPRREGLKPVRDFGARPRDGPGPSTAVERPFQPKSFSATARHPTLRSRSLVRSRIEGLRGAELGAGETLQRGFKSRREHGPAALGRPAPTARFGGRAVGLHQGHRAQVPRLRLNTHGRSNDHRDRRGLPPTSGPQGGFRELLGGRHPSDSSEALVGLRRGPLARVRVGPPGCGPSRSRATAPIGPVRCCSTRAS